jgi:hypothetical protein
MSICICQRCNKNCVPSPLRQGERAEFDTWTLCDYPSDEYDLQLRFRGPGSGFNVDATADPDSDGYELEITAAQTATMSIGQYLWQAWVTEIADTDNTFVVQNGTVTVERGFTEASTGTIDLRSDAKIALDTIDAALLAFSGGDVLEYEITTPAGSRRVKRSDKTQLFQLRKHYAMIVSMERTRDRLRNGGRLMKSVPINVSER